MESTCQKFSEFELNMKRIEVKDVLKLTKSCIVITSMQYIHLNNCIVYLWLWLQPNSSI